MLEILRKTLNRISPYEYRAIVSETLPIYHDRFKVTNKNIVSLKEGDDRLTKLTLESQNNIPVKFHKNFNSIFTKKNQKHKADENFEMNGFKKGQILYIEGTGFLENENDVEEVILVTDKYVYSKNLKTNNICTHSYRELETMNSMNALSIQD